MKKTIIKKPWGYEEIWAQTNEYAGKLLHIDKGHRLSLQYHSMKEETVRGMSGVVEIVYSSSRDGKLKSVILEPGDYFHIYPLMVHRFCASQGTDVDLIEVSTNYLDDVERIEDDYNR